MNDFSVKIKANIQCYEDHRKDYPALDRAAKPLAAPSAPILGREKELEDLRLGLRNPEKANVILLGEPGSGKTALVQGLTYDPNSTQYLTLSVDVERLAADPNADKDAEMANGLLDLVQETTEFSTKYNIIVILFIDEFHRIAMISPSSVEALKPILEKSAHNGFRVIAATTFEEYDEWIAKNRALDQRLLRMDLPELTRDAVINILHSRARQYHVDEFASPEIYGEIYDTSRQILISNSQPRASIDILLNMVGNITKTEYMRDGKLHREYATPEELHLNAEYSLSRPMLNRVIQRAYDIDIDNKIDIANVRKALKTRIFNQDQAVDTILARLEMALAGFNDPTRPKISFLSTGPTGVGKTELAKVIAEALQIPLKRFDMSRYPRPEDAVKFADQLARAAWSAPNAYILIDEAEKSTKECMNTLLQVLDDARLTASNNANRVISFTGNIINLTTNVGSEVYQHQQRFADKDANGKPEPIDTELVYKALADSPKFETAVLGRIDVIVPFLGLPRNAMNKIAERSLEFNLSIAETDKRPIFVSPDILPYIVIDRTSDDVERGGARDAKRNIKNVVIQPLATYLAEKRPEVPLIIRLDQTPRFRDRSIADPLAAKVVVEECYPKATINAWLGQLGTRIGQQLKNEGLFIPVSMTPRTFMEHIISLVQQGVTSFKSTIDITETKIIDSHDSLDIAHVNQLIRENERRKAERIKQQLRSGLTKG